MNQRLGSQNNIALVGRQILNWDALPALEWLDCAIFVFDTEQSCLRWANDAALDLWGADSLEGLLSRDFSHMSEAARTRMESVVETLGQGHTVSESWVLYPRGEPVAVQVTMTGIRLPDGRLASLHKAIPLLNPDNPDSLRGVEALLYTGVLISLFDEDGRALLRNPAALRSFGPLAGPGGDFAAQFQNPAEADRAWRVSAGDGIYQARVAVRALDGHRHHELSVRRVFDLVTGRQLRLAHATDVTDVTEQLCSEHRLWLTMQVFQHVREGIMVTDATNRIVFANPAFTRLTGYPAESVLGQTPGILSSGRHDAGFFRTLWRQIYEQGHWEGEIWNRHREGRIYPVWLFISAVRRDDQHISHYIGSFIDITERKIGEERLRFLATHDSLTGLANRSLFEQHLKQSLARAKSRGRRVAVLFVDLCQFKKINDTLGHSTGDALLRVAAERFRSSLRNGDLMARLGGDEFIAVVEHIEHPADACHTAIRLLKALEKPVIIDDHTLVVKASIGLSLFPDNAQDADTLVAQADTAMYQAKQQSSQSWRLFENTPLTESEPVRNIQPGRP